MISAHAGESLDRMFVHSLERSFSGPAGERAVVTRIDQACPAPGAQMAVLMIASHTFRLVMALHFPPEADTQRLLAAPGPADENAAPPSMRDHMSERGNMCCGMVNRELGRFFAHTGMSTPHIIDSRSAPFMAALPHEHVGHWRVEVDEQLQLQASLCLHTRAPMDFEWQAQELAEVTGELEFF